MVEWVYSGAAVTLGITLAAIFISGIGFYWRQVYDSRIFKEDITEIKTYLKTLNDVVIRLAIQSQRLDNQGERINRVEILIDELRHGKGIVSQCTQSGPHT